MSDKLDIKDLAMPSAAKIIAEKKIDVSKIQGTGLQGRITKGDVLLYLDLMKNDDKLVSKNTISNKIMSNRKDEKMDVLVPILGESVVEATVSKWIKKQGEFVEVDEPIVELETDKVTLEVPASISGILDNLAVSEGDTVEVGALLAMIVAGEKTEEVKKPAVEKKEAEVHQQKVVSNINESKPVAPESKIIRSTQNENLEERVPMSRLRLAIARRLKEAQNNINILNNGHNDMERSRRNELIKEHKNEIQQLRNSYDKKIELLQDSIMSIHKINDNSSIKGQIGENKMKQNEKTNELLVNEVLEEPGIFECPRLEEVMR